MGKRPTLGGKKTLLEVFIFDFNEEIYGEYATVMFKQKCRDEKKFESFDELKNKSKKMSKKADSSFKTIFLKSLASKKGSSQHKKESP